MYPIKLSPAFKDYLWGGTLLRDVYNKDCDFEKVAESWELSCHKDGHSVVANGEFSGATLQEYIDKNGKSILGTACEKFEEFPILIKLIDAKDSLSVQVHPDNEYALRVEGEYGKTEMWYVVDCEEGASLIYGFDKEITKAEFEESIKNNTLLDIATVAPVKKGDVFFIEAGTLHAIGKGILIAEIQQNSNTTYRVYDFGRVGADGKTRPLHIEKAVEVTTLAPAKSYPEAETIAENGYLSKKLASCEYFDVSKITLENEAVLTADATSFHSILLLEGEVTVSSENGEITLKKGETAFIPANMGEYKIIGKGEAIFTKII